MDFHNVCISSIIIICTYMFYNYNVFPSDYLKGVACNVILLDCGVTNNDKSWLINCCDLLRDRESWLPILSLGRGFRPIVS